jgi:hypothetical protein
MAFTIIAGGTFTSTGAGVKIKLPSSADYFTTTNMTQLPLAPNPGVVVRAEWYGSKFGFGQSAANDGIRWKKTNSTNAINIDTFGTATASNGFTYVTSAPVVEAQAANAITAITNASPAVVSQTNTYSNDDIIQFYGTTGMLQISGMNFQISSASGSEYSLIGLRAAGFTAAATAGFTRRISKFAAVDPQFLYVTEITKATQAVVRTSVDPTQYYVVGMKVHFSVPASFGMTQINQMTGTITAMSAANYTMTVDIDSTAFTTFAFPTSASSRTSQLFATIAPAGAKTTKDYITSVETGYNFQYQGFRTGEFTPYMFLSGGAQSPAGADADQINWLAYELEN